MIVVDTSVAFKWFSLEEGNRESALKVLKNHLTGVSSIYVPELFYYELANAWATKTLLPLDQIKEYLKTLQSFQIKITPITFTLLTNAVNFSKKYRVSVYDASYAVLANEKGYDLITSDARFAHQVNQPNVKLLE